MAVRVLVAHVVEAQVAQVPPRLVHERRDALERVDLFHEARQHRRLVAAPGADFEHLRRRASPAGAAS